MSTIKHWATRVAGIKLANPKATHQEAVHCAILDEIADLRADLEFKDAYIRSQDDSFAVTMEEFSKTRAALAVATNEMTNDLAQAFAVATAGPRPTGHVLDIMADYFVHGDIAGSLARLRIMPTAGGNITAFDLLPAAAELAAGEYELALAQCGVCNGTGTAFGKRCTCSAGKRP